MTTNDYQRGYRKGYWAGSRSRWPDYRPIKPPDEVTAALVDALRKIRDRLDTELAMLDPDDDWQDRFGPLIDEADEALSKLTFWIRNDGVC